MFFLDKYKRNVGERDRERYIETGEKRKQRTEFMKTISPFFQCTDDTKQSHLDKMAQCH